MALVGIAIGLLGAFACTRVLVELLFGVKALGPATFLGISILLMGVANLAGYVPSRRAARVSPVEALKYE
jgi:ABC-type antimicrobial peptide transport system permease subunit